MLTLTPSTSSSTIQWPSDLETLEPYFENFEPCAANLFSIDAQFDDQQQANPSDPSGNIVGGERKLNHNANERHRRRKISTLYTSLRSLLPDIDHKIKLSMPATISYALDYIPKLRKQIQELSEKKEDLLRRVSKSRENTNQNKWNKSYTSMRRSSPFVLSLSQLNEQELVIQISTDKLHGNLLSEILVMLETEADGIQLHNASTFEHSGDKVLHTLHFQVGRDYTEQQLQALKEKLQSYMAMG